MRCKNVFCVIIFENLLMNTFAPHLLALLPNLAGPDMLIIFMIVLIMFGAKKLPELAKGLGQAVREFSKAKDDIHGELNRTTQALEVAPSTHPYPDAHHVAPVATVAPVSPTAHVEPHVAATGPVAPVTPAATAAVESIAHTVPASAHTVTAPVTPVPSATAPQSAPGVS